MQNISRNSVLVAGVPRSRGTPVHFEHDDQIAMCVMRGNKVEEMHTPQETFPRIHELMHARHSTSQNRRAYSKVNWLVEQLIEDCRLHVCHWPWNEGKTPDLIKDDVETFMASERYTVREALEKDPKAKGGFPHFAVALRQNAVYVGITGHSGHAMPAATNLQINLVDQVICLLRRGKTKQAAELVQTAFFGTFEEKLKAGLSAMDADDGEEGDEEGGEPGEDDFGIINPPMEIIELPLTERIKEANVGYRNATCGGRLRRSALRKPVLPQRLFEKRAPTMPGGTILVDASGSMGSFDQVTQWVEKAPFGTIAYYAADGRKGQLIVYARNGRKASKIVPPNGQDNLVDGPAMDWLMKQPAPRIMITDREFCSASDSWAQIERLKRLEKAGLVTVLNYL